MGAVVLDQALFEKAKGVENTGRSSPLGATVVPGGVNFSVFSRNASGVELLLFDRENDSRPARVIPIDPKGAFDGPQAWQFPQELPDQPPRAHIRSTLHLQRDNGFGRSQAFPTNQLRWSCRRTWRRQVCAEADPLVRAWLPASQVRKRALS